MVSNVIEFFKAANNLKWIERRGWVAKVGVKQPESVADHCYLTALMCMVFADLKNLNSSKVIKMALLHDLAESIVGDYMPEEVSGEKKNIKKKAERSIPFLTGYQQGYVQAMESFGKSIERNLARRQC